MLLGEDCEDPRFVVALDLMVADKQRRYRACSRACACSRKTSSESQLSFFVGDSVLILQARVLVLVGRPESLNVDLVAESDPAGSSEDVRRYGET